MEQSEVDVVATSQRFAVVVLDLVPHAELCRVDYSTIRPYEALSCNRPIEVHLNLSDPRISNFPSPHSCQLLDARQSA